VPCGRLRRRPSEGHPDGGHRPFRRLDARLLRLPRRVSRGAKLVGTDLSGADLTGAAAENADFTGARLVGTRLLGATLRFAVFKEADMAGADLANADVWNASFDQARNRGASVQEALIEPFVVRERR
jgi:uncharacterized protein YjbI with pentapeptide repeats